MRILFLVFALLLDHSLAQDNRAHGGLTETASITADVVDFIEMITLADISVGTVQPSQEQVNLDPRIDAGAGIILLQGRAHADIRITYTQQIEMVNTTNNSTLNMNYNLAGNNENDQASSQIFLNNPTQVTMGSDGSYYIWIGCLFSLDEVSPGQYDGDFILEVEYI